MSECRFLSTIFGSQKVAVTGDWMNSIMMGFIIFISWHQKGICIKTLFAKSEETRTLWRPSISLDVVQMLPFED
jgi:hypothetical protein